MPLSGGQESRTESNPPVCGAAACQRASERHILRDIAVIPEGPAMTRPVSRRGLLALAGLMAAGCSPAARARPLTLFAAASLTDVLTILASRYEAAGGGPVRLSFAASGAVARQVLAGAPADVVILADAPWMDRLAAGGVIDPASRLDLIGNRLVLIAGEDAAPGGDPLAWLTAAPGRRLAIGDPQSVPAGAYARDYLEKAGRWAAVEPRLVLAADVRAVRTFVQRGEAALGFVYRSDAVRAPGVRIAFTPPSADQPPIVYPAALTRQAAPEAAGLLAFLRSEEAGRAFSAAGFDPAPGAAS
jgi:molybdate transport system substrate-binding protein